MSLPAVLIVDDDPLQLELYHVMLRRLPCAVTTASGGAQALQILRETPTALVILDVLMPRMDGFEVLRAIRADEGLAAVKVILFTVVKDRVDRATAALADKVVAKPVIRDELEWAVTHVLGLANTA